MRFAMFMRDGKKGIAASNGGAFHGLTSDMPGYPGDLEEIIARGEDLREAGGKLAAAPEVDLDAVTFLPPVARPSKILCAGLNYADHAKEIGMETPSFPTIFCRFPSTLVGHEGPILKPAQSDQLDYEAELAVIIGKRGHAIPENEALEYVAGYSIFNDATLRDYQFLTSQWTVGKNFDGSGPFGPWLVTPDELPLGGKGLAISSRLNGETVQRSHTGNMIFDTAKLISLLSAIMTLEAGDVLITGTPSGVGISRKPPLFLKEGDVFEVEIESIGILRNNVVAAP